MRVHVASDSWELAFTLLDKLGIPELPYGCAAGN